MDLEPVFELMDLFLAQTYSEAFVEENQATVDLRRHKEQYGEWVDPMSTHGDKREDLLLWKLQSTERVLASAHSWYAWRRAWFRMVP